MDVLIAAGCALFVQAHCPPPSLPAAGITAWQPEIDRAATSFGLPQAWVKAVMARESGGHTTLHGSPIRSSAGAMGLMQLMPKTYSDLRRQYTLGTNPDDPHDNIAAGTAYLRQMYVRYGYPNMFAAYNAGPGRFDDFLLRNRPLPDETIRYVQAIVPGGEQAFQRPGTRPPRQHGAPAAHGIGGLFVGSQARISSRQDSADGLFVTLSTPHF